MKDALGEVQSVLVLGGTSDIALATVRKIVAQRNASVVLAARKPEACDAAATSLRAAGASAVHAVPFDATDFGSHEAFVRSTFDRFGDFDLVLVAFGVLGDQARAEHDPAAALDIVQTNFTGAVSVTIPLVNRLRAQGHGTVVLLSSVAGERVRRSNFVYGSSKAGIDGYYQGLSASLASSGVHVMIVRPGFVHTKMTDGLKAAPLSVSADDVADAVVRGIARGLDVVWVPPAMRYLMAVLRHLPTAVFRRLPV
ncbi:MAG TPA: decaprenylphospho-beta-D-erythro-pentofuranosid-2-ulose 2-reductase [Acidimicrobiia bacterium]|nr:decaprenylphospho-beta-D-erythro-pentofuranosid-2-ulose 2-reductase [Acidimicrobiia bacterium]